MINQTAEVTKPSRQFLTFLLEQQEYGLEVSEVQEICGFAPISAVPNVPAHVRGVMNLRGTVLPVIDMRRRFGLSEIPPSKFSVIVIAKMANRKLGLLVDAVSDVLTVNEDEMHEAPDFGSEVDAAFIENIFRTRERLVVVLDLNRLLSADELIAPEAAVA